MVLFCCRKDGSLAKKLSEFLEPWCLSQLWEPLCRTDGSNPKQHPWRRSTHTCSSYYSSRMAADAAAFPLSPPQSSFFSFSFSSPFFILVSASSYILVYEYVLVYCPYTYESSTDIICCHLLAVVYFRTKAPPISEPLFISSKESVVLRELKITTHFRMLNVRANEKKEIMKKKKERNFVFGEQS